MRKFKFFIIVVLLGLCFSSCDKEEDDLIPIVEEPTEMDLLRLMIGQHEDVMFNQYGGPTHFIDFEDGYRWWVYDAPAPMPTTDGGSKLVDRQIVFVVNRQKWVTDVKIMLKDWKDLYKSIDPTSITEYGIPNILKL